MAGEGRTTGFTPGSRNQPAWRNELARLLVTEHQTGRRDDRELSEIQKSKPQAIVSELDLFKSARPMVPLLLHADERRRDDAKAGARSGHPDEQFVAAKPAILAAIS
jgi:hypothetical protein